MTTTDLDHELARVERDIEQCRAAMHNVDPPRQAVMHDQISELVTDLARLDNMRRGCAANLDE